jgi:hypothetical protein
MTDSEPLSDVFGGWQFTSITGAPGVSFDLGGTSEAQLPVWRQELPSDPEVAAAQLQENEARMQLSMQALEAITGRIDALVESAQPAGMGGISFAAVSLEDLPEPETELMDLVQTINKPAAGVSFAVGGEDQSKLEAAFAQFGADMEHLLRLVTHFAWVETNLEGTLVGRSIVSWTGDMDTSWKSGLKDEVHQLHKSSLNQALATRNLVLHAVTITAKSAAKLAVLLATPGGAILALPVAWKFIKQILADVNKYKELTKIPI